MTESDNTLPEEPDSVASGADEGSAEESAHEVFEPVAEPSGYVPEGEAGGDGAADIAAVFKRIAAGPITQA